MTKMLQINEARIGSQEQQEQNQITEKITAGHSNGSVETCSRTTDVPQKLLFYSDTSKLSPGDLSSIYLAASLGTLESTTGVGAVINSLMIIQGPDFYSLLFNIQFNSIMCCPENLTV